MFWISHHYQFHFVERTDRALLNLLFLLTVSTVPFSTALLGPSPLAAILIYSLNLLVLVGFLHEHQLPGHPPRAASRASRRRSSAASRSGAAFRAGPIMSALIALYSPRFALYLYSARALHFVPKGGVREPSAHDATRDAPSP